MMRRMNDFAALYPQHGDVRLLVQLHDLGIELAPVGERDADLGRAADLDDDVERTGNSTKLQHGERDRPPPPVNRLEYEPVLSIH